MTPRCFPISFAPLTILRESRGIYLENQKKW